MIDMLRNSIVLLVGLSACAHALAIDYKRDSSPVLDCTSAIENGPVFVDATCVDPMYSAPVMDTRGNYTIAGFDIMAVQGHFEDTTTNFTIYFPINDKFENRFFQLVYPIPLVIIPIDELVPFAAESGGYVVSVQGLIGYRHEAATAKFARALAADYYGTTPEAINGYVFGGSGGSYQAAAILENTSGVWQGAVPFIQAIPTSLPLSGTSAAFGLLVLGDQRQDVIDSLQPGGSDPRRSLSESQVAIYDELVDLGFPPRGYESLNYTFVSSGLPVAAQGVRVADPSYADDFWSLDGYVGAEQSDLGNFFRSLRQVGELDIHDKQYNGSLLVSFTTAILDANSSIFGSFFSIVYENGTHFAEIDGSLSEASDSFLVLSSFNQSLPDGAKLKYDNSWFLAMHPFHRYQIPKRPDFYPWSQFIDANGTPKYPQRPIEIAPQSVPAPSGGGTQTGKFLFKAIMVQNLLDVNAQPWNADWYRKQVIRQLGPDQDLYRIYYNDNADHFETGPHPNNNFAPYIVSYKGILYQALRDLADWVENGVEPPRNSQYSVEDSQIKVPYEADKRGGIQPVVHLCANQDERRVEVKSNQSIPFRAVAKVPTEQGCIVQISWDYEGVGNWQSVTVEKAESYTEIYSNYTYSEPGTYFPAIRVGSSRECLLDERYVIPLNLDRVRVVVS